MDLSVIIVNWNSEAYLVGCLSSIQENTHDISYEIIVVDNASPAGGIDEVCAANPAVKLIKSSDNVGFAKANNLGFQHAIGKYVLLLNPDTKLIGPAVNELLESARSISDLGIIGGKLVDPDLSVQTTSIQKFPTILNQITDIELLRRRWPRCRLWQIDPLFDVSQRVTSVEVISGACMLLPRDVYARVGGFTEDYFMYAEDIDLNRKVAHIGLARYYEPAAIIIHYGGTSSKQQKVSQWATIMKYRAMWQYYIHNYSYVYAWTYRVAMLTSATVRLFLLAVAFPFTAMQHKGVKVRGIAAKWSAVLRWAIGCDNLAPQGVKKAV